MNDTLPIQGETVSLNGKLIIGLTGNIATGKSAVMRLAIEQDALTLDADKIVHEIMDNDAQMQAALAVAFGGDIRKGNGRIDRRKLGEIVFKDPAALQDLEAMLHPEVHRQLAQRIQNSDAKIIMIEAIKLLEGNLIDICHKVWVTRCAPQRQLERLRICRGLDTKEATTRIKAQPPQAEKVAVADVVIDTNGYMRDTETQFRMAWRRLPDPTSVETKQLVVPPKQEPIEPAQREKTEKSDAQTTDTPEKTAPPLTETPRPDNLQVRRAKPSDIPGILLLIQRATDGKVKMKRAELLMALSERGYFIGQVDSEISIVAGFSIDSQIAQVDQIYVYPLEMAAVTGTAVIEEVSRSAFNHMAEIAIIYLPNESPPELHAIVDAAGYITEPKEQLARNWQVAIEENQPDDTFFVIKIFRDTRVK
ncbi:MAG: dephospho-CoA kinase [Chloroflexi bacterium]|nr:dephospho-CoA kinase [Chloroflexota bacterium]